MSTPLYTCLDCKSPVHLNPPLSRRIGQNGIPMTKDEALCIFRDDKGGRCTKCYLAKRSRESEELMRKHVLQYDKVQVIHIT